MSHLSLGYLLARLEQRLARIEASIGELRTEVEWLRRMAWMAALWVPGSALNIETEKAADLVLGLLKAIRLH